MFIINNPSPLASRVGRTTRTLSLNPPLPNACVTMDAAANAPSTTDITDLAHRVEHYLALHLHSSALFLAERLHAASSSQVSLHLLATCLVYAGDINAAVELLLEQATAPANLYLAAVYLLRLGKPLAAENALLRVRACVVAAVRRES